MRSAHGCRIGLRRCGQRWRTGCCSAFHDSFRFRFWAITALAASLGLPVPAAGQAPSGTDASALMARMMRAQRGGEAAAARNMADSVLSVLPLADERRADALFVRATTAPTPVAARTDWLRIVVDHPVSPRVEDALLALADLEWKAGDRAAATRHLQRLVGVGLTTERSVREAHRQGVQLLQGNEARLGCAVLEAARIGQRLEQACRIRQLRTRRVREREVEERHAQAEAVRQAQQGAAGGTGLGERQGLHGGERGPDARGPAQAEEHAQHRGSPDADGRGAVQARLALQRWKDERPTREASAKDSAMPMMPMVSEIRAA